jgi:hypothetical protein
LVQNSAIAANEPKIYRKPVTRATVLPPSLGVKLLSTGNFWQIWHDVALRIATTRSGMLVSPINQTGSRFT